MQIVLANIFNEKWVNEKLIMALLSCFYDDNLLFYQQINFRLFIYKLLLISSLSDGNYPFILVCQRLIYG